MISSRMAMLPRSPTAMRTTLLSLRRGGMKSTILTEPSAVSNRVSRMSVLPRYRRVTRTASSRGAISQRPWSGVPRSAAKHASESNRGQHSQSIEPSRPTSAALSQSPISA